MNNDVPRTLRELASMQSAVVSRPQALAAGVTKATLTWQLSSGRWQQLRRGVYAMFSGEPSREATLWAAVLRVGRDAMLSHHTAAEVTGLTDRLSSRIHITVPASRRVDPEPGLVIHTCLYAGRTRHPSRLPPRTRVEDTVLDLVGLASSFDEACGWVTSACGRRLTTEPRLLEAMALRGRQRWRIPLAQVLTSPAGSVHSVLEYRYYHGVERAHCLPQAFRQVRVVSGRQTRYRDAFYSLYRVVVELDGRLAHPGDTRWRDIHRDNATAAEGSITLRYGWSDVTTYRCRTAGQLGRVLTQRGWVGTPKLCSAECTMPHEFL
jgi:hypothetical protein